MKLMIHSLLAIFLSFSATAADKSVIVLKTESFDRDPNWEGFNNHVPSKVLATVQQDFGYRESNFAGKEKGEIGGNGPLLVPQKVFDWKLVYDPTASDGKGSIETTLVDDLKYSARH